MRGGANGGGAVMGGFVVSSLRYMSQVAEASMRLRILRDMRMGSLPILFTLLAEGQA